MIQEEIPLVGESLMIKKNSLQYDLFDDSNKCPKNCPSSIMQASSSIQKSQKYAVIVLIQKFKMIPMILNTNPPLQESP